MDEKLICCQVCQVYFVSASAYFQPNPSVWPNTAQPAPGQSAKSIITNSEISSVPLSFLKISLKQRKLENRNTQSTDHIVKVFILWTAGKQSCEERESIVAGDRENEFTATERRLLLLPWQRKRERVWNLVTLCKCVTAASPTWKQTSRVFCVSVCRIFLCHAMSCICAGVTRLISLLLAEWIKKTYIHCFFFSLLLPFHAIICAKKGELKHRVPPPPVSAPFFSIGQRGGTGGTCLLGLVGLQDLLTGVSSDAFGQHFSMSLQENTQHVHSLTMYFIFTFTHLLFWLIWWWYNCRW